MLANKKILVAVCGSIAAYKAAFFVRLLVKEGAQVQVIMTQSATNFITPLTLSTLTTRPVYTTSFDQKSGEWHNHVELGLWADLMIIAPLSANTLGKMANGLCDNLLLATYLSAKCPVLVAPAMDLDMYAHATTQQNLAKLRGYGNQVVEAREGDLASGLQGQGRMAEPEELVEIIKEKLSSQSILSGKKVLITSGATREAIDPVRFISNHSSGKMGAALADVCTQAGAEVCTVIGAASVYPSNGKIIEVTSAQEMLQEVQNQYPEADIVIFAAAVADYRPYKPATQKMKKNDGELMLSLIKNPDIAFEMGKIKEHCIHVGFALETENEEAYALKKLDQKNFDLIVLNSPNDAGAGFAHDTNKVTFFDKNKVKRSFELKQKEEVALDIINHIAQWL